MEMKPILAGSLNKYDFRQADSVWSIYGIAPSVMAHNGGTNGHQIQILAEEEYEVPTTALHKSLSDEGL